MGWGKTKGNIHPLWVTRASELEPLMKDWRIMKQLGSGGGRSVHQIVLKRAVQEIIHQVGEDHCNSIQMNQQCEKWKLYPFIHSNMKQWNEINWVSIGQTGKDRNVWKYVPFHLLLDHRNIYFFALSSSQRSDSYPSNSLKVQQWV